MKNYFFLSAIGLDKPKIVFSITKFLFQKNCNLEDSSMMRLGSEFAIFLIFTSPVDISTDDFSSISKQFRLNIHLKNLSPEEARFIPQRRYAQMVIVHGPDKKGIVYETTRCLANHSFNITDLYTHRTIGGGRPGYILFIEGELLKKNLEKKLKQSLLKLQRKMGTKIQLNSVTQLSL